MCRGRGEVLIAKGGGCVGKLIALELGGGGFIAARGCPAANSKLVSEEGEGRGRQVPGCEETNMRQESRMGVRQHARLPAVDVWVAARGAQPAWLVATVQHANGCK